MVSIVTPMQTISKSVKHIQTALYAAVLSLLTATAHIVHAAPGDILQTIQISNSEPSGVPTPTGYQGIVTHDGYLWVLDQWSDRIYRVYPETVYDEDGFTILKNPGDSDFNIPVPDNLPNGLPFCDTQNSCRAGGSLTFARNFFWNASPVTDDIIKLDPVDGDNLESENTPQDNEYPAPLGMTYDGTHFWIVDWQSNTINKVLPEDGSVIATIPGPSALPACGSQSYDNIQFCARPFGIAWDGYALWVTEREEKRIYRINPANGDVITYIENASFLNDPLGLAWDGEFLWATNRDNDTSSSIHKIESGVIPFGILGCVEKNGIGVNGDVLLSQNAETDQTATTDGDGCFVFPDFASGVPLSVSISETGNDKKPVLTLVDGDITLLVGDTYADPGVIATDDEDGDISANVTSIPDVLNLPSLIDTSAPGPAEGVTVTYYVIDSVGNAADPITRTIYVLEIDIVPPVITLNGDNPLYVEQGTSYVELGASAIDARDGDISEDVLITGAVNTASSGTYTLSYDVTDAAGNSAVTVERTVIVQDTTPPVITLIGPTPLTLEKGDTYIEQGAIATDNIDGDVSGSIAIAGTVSENLTGSYVLTYNVSDSAGNTATTVLRTILVEDTTAPVITLLGSTTINHELNALFTDPGYTALDAPSDDLTGNVIVSGSVDATSTGVYTLTYTLTDGAGNTAIPQTRTVDVADRTAPVLTITGDNPLEHEQGTTYLELGATAIDAVDGDISANIVITGDTVDGFATGIYSVNYDITDAAGNSAPTMSRTVNVSDTTPPLITLLGNPVIEQELGTSYVDAGASASDNIDGDITGSIIIGGDTVDTNIAGDYTITYFLGQDRTVLATRPITVTAVNAQITAPQTATAGSTIQVGWTGPDNDDDYIGIGVAGAGGAAGWENYTYTREGQTLDLLVPVTPGTYDITYFLSQDRTELASSQITVTPVTAAITAPAVAPAGGEVQIEWTGPDYHDDYIAIGRTGAEGGARWERYAYTRDGSPLTLQVPDEPGDYVVTYFLSQDRTTIATRTISVQ